MAQRAFSWPWAIGSVVIFIVVELLIGGLLGQFVDGFKSYALGFTLQGLLHIAAFLVGGFLIGVVSPGERTIEPAVGAFISMAMLWFIKFVSPYPFFSFSLRQVFVGGSAMFLVAMAGAWGGERLTRQV